MSDSNMSGSARRDTLFGLPRYVLAILRHMEVHSERLKWSVAEESNQLTLTLTWNFDSGKPRKNKETIWKKLQRSLGLDRTISAGALHGTVPITHSGTTAQCTTRHGPDDNLVEKISTRGDGIVFHVAVVDCSAAAAASIDFGVAVNVRRLAAVTLDPVRSQLALDDPVWPPSPSTHSGRRSQRYDDERGGGERRLTSRCRSMPGRMEIGAGSTTIGGPGGTGVVVVDDWENRQRSHSRPGRRPGSVDPRVVDQRAVAASAAQSRSRRQYQAYVGRAASPCYVTSSSHLTLPAQRTPSSGSSLAAIGTAAPEPRLHGSRPSGGGLMTMSTVASSSRSYQQQQNQQQMRSRRRRSSGSRQIVSPSHFSWPGTSFEAAVTVSEGVPSAAEDDEGRSSGGTTTQGGPEPASPSLPSSTSTNPPLQCGTTANSSASGGAGTAQRQHGSRSSTVVNGGRGGGGSGVGAGDDEELTDDQVSESTTGGAGGEILGRDEDERMMMMMSAELDRDAGHPPRCASCEFDVLDEDYWLSSRRRWSKSDSAAAHADWTWRSTRSDEGLMDDRCDWTIGGDDLEKEPDDHRMLPPPPPPAPIDDIGGGDEGRQAAASGTAAASTAAAVGAEDLPFNETVMKCIESCDKVLLRHSTAIR